MFCFAPCRGREGQSCAPSHVPAKGGAERGGLSPGACGASTGAAAVRGGRPQPPRGEEGVEVIIMDRRLLTQMSKEFWKRSDVSTGLGGGLPTRRFLVVSVRSLQFFLEQRAACRRTVKGVATAQRT